MSEHDVTSKARQMLQESMSRRLAAVETASEKARLHEQLQAKLATAEAEMEAAWKAAVEAGWDERELKRLGLMKPGTRARRPKAAKARGAGETLSPDGTASGADGSGHEGDQV